MTLSWPQESEQPQASETLLADQSLLLILVLVNHCTREDSLYNPYREALLSFSSSHGFCEFDQAPQSCLSDSQPLNLSCCFSQMIRVQVWRWRRSRWTRRSCTKRSVRRCATTKSLSSSTFSFTATKTSSHSSSPEPTLISS